MHTIIARVHRHRLIVATIMCALVLSGVGVATLWFHPPTARAAGPGNTDVLVIHGFNGYKYPNYSYATMSSWGYDCTAYNTGTDINSGLGAPGDAVSVLGSNGWSPKTIGYYAGASFLNGSSRPGSYMDGDTGCDGYLYDEAWHCSGESPGNIGSNNEDLRHVGCELAWYIFDHYSSHNLEVRVLAHSMGGLLIRWALYAVQSHNGNYPPYLYVPAVVTLATPHGGIIGVGAGCIPTTGCSKLSLCDQCIQGGQMDPHESTFMAPLMQGNGLNPQGTGNTIWTNMGSAGDEALTIYGAYYVNYPTAFAMNSRNKYIYDYQNITGANAPRPVTPIYTHGGIFADRSTSNDATVIACTTLCGPPPLSWFEDGTRIQYWEILKNQLHSLALAANVLYKPAPGATLPPTPTPVPPTVTPVPPTPSTAWCTNVSYATSSLTGLAAGSSIATTFTVHYAYANSACSVSYVQSIGFGAIYTAGTLRSDLFQCSWSGCGNIVVGVPYGPPIPFTSGWYGATIPSNQLITVYSAAGTDYFCVQADGMYQQNGSANQSFVWTPGAPGLCYPRVWSTTTAPSPTTPPAPPPATQPNLDGWIDGANGIVVSGWACDDANGAATSTVSFYADADAGQSGSVVLGTATANINRPDLVAAGVCGSTGAHGYQFTAHVTPGSHALWAYNSVDGAVKALNGSGNVTVGKNCLPVSCS